ncbi:TRAP transporter permease [Calditerrivibrio nitroreducens]|uniref:TRAP transporter, 4TM/12TM fusion protein n=1 Tax=Calditerrivibrio nitroreducens (strain DSM 19672 / NBRC 101217 / Yu37-1) TaxID=768670 RepID=E4TFB3_CALNY|nr:TRAP transporter permease [Calditerrivibrio nitroreducens]ADR18452.1 TRAP transporter, 4TM/12TM fusion protein [Calditerrivibrio nitroreducens DSM 19672]
MSVSSNIDLEELVKEDTGSLREPRKFEKVIISLVAIGWVVFQFGLLTFIVLDSARIRAIHLTFATVLAFLCMPLLRRKKIKGFFSFLSARDRIPLLDYIFAALGFYSVMYTVFNFKELTERAGLPSDKDILFGIISIVFILEATRRVIGIAMPVIVILFSLYVLYGSNMPDFLALKSVSMTKFMNQIYLSTEGIFGIPLGVSAGVVFYFVLLGAILEKAGAGKFFIDLALSVFGKYKGGPAKAAIVSSGLTGLVSGSSIANVVTTGTFTIPLMKKVGYPAKKAAATEVAASIDGQIMPPVMGAAAFIIGEYVGVPYIEVIKAAAIPAFTSYFALFFVSHLEASKLGIKGLPAEETPKFMETLKKGFIYLLPIFVLLYELVILRHSPEMSAFRAIIFLILIMLVKHLVNSYKNRESYFLAIKRFSIDLIDGFVTGSKSMMSVALACASAGIIVGIVTLGVGGMLTQIVESISQGNIYILVFVTAFASLLLGMGLPTTATYIVMASLIAPVIVELGGNYGFMVPLMAAHLFCFYFGMLADDTPPVGLGSYAAAALAGSNPIETGLQGFVYHLRTFIIPFMFIFNPDLILHGINSWSFALFIFAMSVIGGFSFASLLQGWLITKNKWYEMPLLLAASLICFNPKIATSLLNLSPDYRYYFYALGVALFIMVILIQKFRIKSSINPIAA